MTKLEIVVQVYHEKLEDWLNAMQWTDPQDRMLIETAIRKSNVRPFMKITLGEFR